MSKIFNKASKMLVDNHHRRNWRLGAGAMAIVLAAVVSVMLVGRASALTGGNTLHDALTGDSALLWEAADAPTDGDQSAWQKVDPNTPVDSSARLRLRLAFKLGADALQSGNQLQVQLPDGVALDQTNPIRGDVYSDQTVADPKGLNAARIGSYEIQDNIITFTFDDDVCAQNVSTTTDGVQVDGQQVGGYADIDLTFANLSLDADGLAQIQLNDLVKLEITQQAAASEDASAVDGASDAAATDAAAIDAAASATEPAATEAASADAAATPASDTASTDAANDAAATAPAADTASATDTAAATDAATSTDAAAQTDTDAASDQSATSTDSTATEQAADEATDDGESSATVQTLSTNTLTSVSSTNALLSKVSTLSVNALNATTAIDFGQYLTNDTTVQKLENGKWTTATSINDGDEVRVNLAYSLPANTVDSTNRTITYTLPNGIKPVQNTSGRATDSDGKEIGDYTINTDGTVTVTFDESFASQKGAIVGNVTFQGKVSASDAGDSGKVHFGGNAADVTIVKPHDIKTEKTGTLDFDKGKISNTVTVSTTKGTGDTVKLEDSINNGNCTNAKPAYDKNSLKIVKVDASDNQTAVTGYTPKWTSDSNGIGFSIEGLPALAAGEKYVATYDVNVNATDANKAGKVGNSAHAHSGNHDDWGWSSKDWQDEFQKTGEFNKETGLISWRIKVNPNGKDMTKGSAWKVTDVLPDGCTLYGQYTVWGAKSGTLTTGGSWGDKKIDYTFPTSLNDTQKTDTYYIDYWTTAPAGNGNVTNNAKITENGNTASDSETIGVEHRTYDLTKKFTSESADSTTGKIHTNRWSVDATLPDTQLSTFEYTDTIENAVDGDGNDMGANSHYAYASKLDSAFSKHLYMVVDDYTQYQYKGAANPTYYYRSDNASLCGNTTDVTIKVTYYDASGNEVPATDSTTPVKSFKIKVSIASGHKIFAKHLKIDEYSTYSDTRSATEGSTWTVKNTGTIAGKSSTASHDIDIPKTFDKQVYTGKGGNGANKYKSGDTSVDYDAMGGVLSYRLMLNTTKADEGTITITDTLPKGETVVGGSVTARFFLNEYDLHDDNYVGTKFVDGTNPTYTTTANADGTTTLTITIPNYKYSDSYPKVAVYYKADISKDDDWSDPTATKKTYSNTATWNSNKSSQNTTVTRESKSVTKTGVQLDKNGNPVVLENGQPKVEPSNKVRYYVDINPAGKDLNPKSKTLTLTDTMQDLSKYDPQLDMSSIKLYAYDITAEHHVNLSKEISSDRYSVKYDQKGTITVTVPDELACVLVYDYTIDRDAVTSGSVVQNNCSLDGSWSDSSKMELREITAFASAYHKIITMYKVDADNYQKPVKATFKLEYWDKSSSYWKTKSDALETTDGKLTWDVGGTTPELTSDTLYRLTETQTQEGYSLDSTPHYFIWMSAQNNSDTSYNNSGASSAKKPDGSTYIAKDQISIFKNTGGSMYVTNKYTSLAVKKDWAHEDGSKASAPSGSSVTMQLERYTMYDDPDQTCAVSIHEEGTPVSGSTWYDQKDLTTFNIQRGSSLTIKFNDWHLDVDVYVNGEKYQSFTNSQGLTSITIDADKLGGPTAQITVKTTNMGNIATINLQDCVYTKPAAKSTEHEVVDTVTLNDANDWTKLWTGLAQKDSSGNTYNYVVKELSSTVAAKSVAYSNNDGIQTGTIVVTNTLGDSYELPKTGGSGTSGITLLGVAVALASAGALLARRARKDKGTE